MPPVVNNVKKKETPGIYDFHMLSCAPDFPRFNIKKDIKNYFIGC